MTGHLARLVLRAVGPAGGMRPRTPSLFERPPAGTVPSEPVTVAPTVVAPPPPVALREPSAGDRATNPAPGAERVPSWSPAPRRGGSTPFPPPAAPAEPAAPAALGGTPPPQPGPDGPDRGDASVPPHEAHHVAAAAARDAVRPGPDRATSTGPPHLVLAPGPSTAPEASALRVEPEPGPRQTVVAVPDVLPRLLPAPRDEPRTAAPSVTVNIGRIEVLQPAPEPRPRAPERPRPRTRDSGAPGLADYLRERTGR